MSRYAALVFAISLVAVSAPAVGQTFERMREDPVHVRDWNAFAEACLALHEQQLAQQAVREETRIGGYVGNRAFYREVSYYARDSGALLSRVQWERESPERLHAVEVFVRDAQGRVLRDYAAAFLPQGRNAPVQTLINLHAYNGALHAFRQFDASGARIYESCEGTHDREPLRMHLFEEDLLGASEEVERIMASKAYRACFENLPERAGKYLDPQ